MLPNGKTAAQTLVELHAAAVGGPSATDIAAALLAAMNSSPPSVNVKLMNSAPVVGNGDEADPWRGAGVSP